MSKLVRRFEDLDAWRMAIDLSAFVYEISAARPFSRDFALSEQIHKSANSISSNIAEGFERNSRREFRRFLAIAKGSCGELRSQIHLAHRLKYIAEETHDLAAETAEKVSLKIGRLRESMKKNESSRSHSSPVTRHSSR